MKIKYSSMTDKGSVRQANEDSLFCDGLIVNQEDSYETPEVEEKEIGEDPVCFAVADGMGGHASGEVASRMALEKLSEALDRQSREFIEDTEVLKEAILRIHREVNSFGNESNKKRMGTTLVGTLFNSEKCIVFNVGDSRLYRFHDTYLSQITVDHSAAQLYGGNVPKNVIVSAVGGGIDNIIIDTFDLTGKIMDNDILVLCSDGLTDIDMNRCYEDIKEIIRDNAEDLQEVNRSLVKFALEEGSSDNISIISIKISL